MLVDGVEMEVLHSREKESVFKKSVPILHPVFAYLNLVPGLGTFLGALSLVCCGKTSFETNLEGMLVGIGTAFLQALSSILIVGWFWSLMHGMYFIRKSQAARAEKEAERK